MNQRFGLPLLLTLGLLLCPAVPVVRGEASPKPVISRLDDLPRHTYPVDEPPSVLVTDDAKFAALAAAYRHDIDSDLATYDIQDRATLQRFKYSLFFLAVLDHDFPRARELLAEVRSLEQKPSLKLTTGLSTETWMDVSERHLDPSQRPAAFESAYAERIAALPWNLVQNDLMEAHSSYQIRSRALIIGQIAETFDPAAAKNHSVSGDVVQTLIAVRLNLEVLLPLKAQIVAALGKTIDAHRVQKPDLWSQRLVTLSPTEHDSTVLVGIWDSGSDPRVYSKVLFTDADGKHGFAYDLHSNPVPDLLQPLGDAAPRLNSNLDRLKGFMDLQANVQSPEADKLKTFMAGLSRAQVKPFFEDLEEVGNYSHGTHVTGIAIAGNPFARIVIGRITYDYHMIPEKPTIEQAKKDAAAELAQAAYFRDHQVRVVNMSWGGSLREVEDALEANGAGGTPQERAKLARQIFDIGRNALYQALKDAPNVLFVAAAGNSDNNVKFDEFIPSSFQLPNMITVGAVDQAGEETSFSSFGPMVNVHANGYEVDSYVPGGRRLRLSGTSMAAPQVTNLAAKLFAIDPKLTVAQAKLLILHGCEQKGRVNLISEVNSIHLLRQEMQNGQL